MKKKNITYKLQKNELKVLENIRKIALISLFSDDYLMDIFALKGEKCYKYWIWTPI